MSDVIEKDEVGYQNTAKKTTLFDDLIRYEQIGNVIYMMAMPSETHEAIVVELTSQLKYYLVDKPCRVYGSNIGLDLKEFIPAIKQTPSFQSYFKKNIKKGTEEETYLLPDVTVLCDADKTKFTSHGYRGVPKMLIEVSSPSTSDKDFDEKRSLYEMIGVAEYWIVSDAQNVTAYVLKNGKFKKTKYQTEDAILKVPVSIFPGLFISFDKSKIELL